MKSSRHAVHDFFGHFHHIPDKGSYEKGKSWFEQTGLPTLFHDFEHMISKLGHRPFVGFGTTPLVHEAFTGFGIVLLTSNAFAGFGIMPLMRQTFSGFGTKPLTHGSFAGFGTKPRVSTIFTGFGNVGS